jgi:CMP-N-acetylneuraminic acid synthetase
MKVLGLIPARGGSKGVPGKNTKLLGTKPLLQYTIETALQTKAFDEIAVSSDSENILEIAGRFIGIKCIKRPAALASDESPTIEAVKHALQEYKILGKDFDAVCILQVTNPFRTAKLIISALNKFKLSTADSLVSVREVPHEFNPHWVFEQDNTGFLTLSTGDKNIISRRQNLPPAYYRDGAVYMVKQAIVLKEGSLYGKKIDFVVNTDKVHINIDTIEDWQKAEEHLKNKS